MKFSDIRSIVLEKDWWLIFCLLLACPVNGLPFYWALNFYLDLDPVAVSLLRLFCCLLRSSSYYCIDLNSCDCWLVLWAEIYLIDGFKTGLSLVSSLLSLLVLSKDSYLFYFGFRYYLSLSICVDIFNFCWWNDYSS